MKIVEKKQPDQTTHSLREILELREAKEIRANKSLMKKADAYKRAKAARSQGREATSQAEVVKGGR